MINKPRDYTNAEFVKFRLQPDQVTWLLNEVHKWRVKHHDWIMHEGLSFQDTIEIIVRNALLSSMETPPL